MSIISFKIRHLLYIFLFLYLFVYLFILIAQAARKLQYLVIVWYFGVTRNFIVMYLCLICCDSFVMRRRLCSYRMFSRFSNTLWGIHYNIMFAPSTFEAMGIFGLPICLYTWLFWMRLCLREVCLGGMCVCTGALVWGEVGGGRGCGMEGISCSGWKNV